MESKERGSPRGFGEQGNMANFNWGTREQRQNILGNMGTKKSSREHGNKTLQKGGEKKREKKVKGTYLATFSLHPCRQHFISICLHGIVPMVELGYENESWSHPRWLNAKPLLINFNLFIKIYWIWRKESGTDLGVVLLIHKRLQTWARCYWPQLLRCPCQPLIVNYVVRSALIV